MDSKELKVPASESDKVEASVLGYRFSEKAEHLPIKKRRFVFRASSPPPLETTSPEVTKRVADQEVQPKPDASYLPVTSSEAVNSHQSDGSDGKVDVKEPVKAKASDNEDIRGISLGVVVPAFSKSLGGESSTIVSSGAKGLEAPCTVKSEEIIMKPPPRDERLLWDLNTVMDAWEEPLECSNITYAKRKKNVCKEGREFFNAYEDAVDKTLRVDLKSLTRVIEETELDEERKPSCADVSKLLFPVIDDASRVSVNRIDGSSDVRSTLTLQYTEFDISNLNCKGTITENEKNELSLMTASSSENGVRQTGSIFNKDVKSEQSPLTETSEKPITSLTGTVYDISRESPDNLVNYNKERPLDNSFGYENFHSDLQARSEVDNVEGFSVGYDSQFEDGEFRESSIQTWEGNEGVVRENERLVRWQNRNFRKEAIGQGVSEDSSVILPEKLDGIDRVSGSGPNEASDDTERVVVKAMIGSDEWKMNVSGWDVLPENHDTLNNVTKIGESSGIEFSSRMRRRGSENGDAETKDERSRFYKREPISRVRGLSTRDAFLNRGRLRMQGCSFDDVDDSTPRPVREPGTLRPLRRGKYTPYIPANGRGRGATWNRHSPPYPGPNLSNEISIDPNDDNRPGSSSYTNRQSFGTRMPVNRVNSEADEYRARLGLRPSGDAFHNRERPLRYSSSSRHSNRGPTGRYGGLASDEFNEPLTEYPHPHPSRTRTRSPISDGFRRRLSRSRSPVLRRPRFEADHANEYNFEPRNYKPRTSVFERNSPPPPGDGFGLYDSSRNTKPNENYRPGRFPELQGAGKGSPRYFGSDGDLTELNGFVRRYGMGRPVKQSRYDEEYGYGYGPVYDSREEGLEFHGRRNSKLYINGTDGRFRELPRRPREERENW